MKEHSFSFILVSILLFYDEKNIRYEQFTTCTPFTTVGHFVFGGHLENGGTSSAQGSEFNVCHVKNIW